MKRKLNKDIRVQDVSRVIHSALQGTVDMREGGSTTAEAHGLAEVIAAISTKTTVTAHDAGLYGDALANI